MTERTEALRTNERPYMLELEQIQDYFEKGAGSFDGYVPADILTRDLHLPFKPERTRWLVNSFKDTRDADGWGNGQDSPLLGAFITGEDEPSLDVYDGLHRQLAIHIFQEIHGVEPERPPEVVRAIGARAIAFVTIKPMSRRDMLEKRLENTGNHPELRSSRGGLWISQLWNLDEVSSLGEVSILDALKLADKRERIRDGEISEPKNGIGARFDLSPNDTEVICNWVDEHLKKWDVETDTVQEWIVQSEATAPSLVALLRNVGKGHSSKGYFTPSMLNTLIKHMPGKEFWRTHEALAEFAMDRGLGSGEFTRLIHLLTLEPAMLEEFKDSRNTLLFLEAFDVSTLDTPKKKTTTEPDAPLSEGVVPTPDSPAGLAAVVEMEEQARLAWERVAPQDHADTYTVRSREEIEIARDQIDLTKAAATLTSREIEILQAFADGLHTPHVADALFISQKTVKNHLASIYEKLGAGDRTEAVMRGLIAGVIGVVSPEPDEETPDLDNRPEAEIIHIDRDTSSRKSGEAPFGKNRVFIPGSNLRTDTLAIDERNLIGYMKSLLPRVEQAMAEGWSPEEVSEALDVSISIAEIIAKVPLRNRTEA